VKLKIKIAEGVEEEVYNETSLGNTKLG